MLEYKHLLKSPIFPFDSRLWNGQFGNGKGMKNFHSQSLGTGREWKNPFPKFGNGKGMKKDIPEIREREGNEKIHSQSSGTGIRGLHSWEWPGTGIPAHPCHIIALCGYPHVKVSIRKLNQISTTAPIFQQYNYFRQNLEENVTFTFFLFSFASNFPCKILWDNKNIEANICIFQIPFWQWWVPRIKKYFEGFFSAQSDLLVCRISTLSDTLNRFFANRYPIFCKYCVGIFFQQIFESFSPVKTGIIRFRWKLSKN